MSVQTLDLTPEQQRILWACYAYWAASPAPPEQRLVCYTWVLYCYQQRFGGEFTPPQLRSLAQLGLLRPGHVVRGGGRRYYTLADPQRVHELLGEWGLR
jgi:hypothetical protein